MKILFSLGRRRLWGDLSVVLQYLQERWAGNLREFNDRTRGNGLKTRSGWI